jgi:acyl dehydratase
MSPSRTITETDLVWFAALTGDWNPIHTDALFAKTSQFGERIAHGMLILALGTGLITRIALGTFLPESLIAVVGVDRVRLIKPVKIGDTIHVECEIVETTNMPEKKGLLTVRFRTMNQTGEPVQTGRWKCLVGCRPF